MKVPRKPEAAKLTMPAEAAAALRVSERMLSVHTIVTACPVACPPVRIRPIFTSAPGGFYFQAFTRSVSLPVAGYDYNSDWTSSVGGLSPARMTASFAALIQSPRRRASRRIVSSCSLAPKKINLNVNSITFTADRADYTVKAACPHQLARKSSESAFGSLSSTHSCLLDAARDVLLTGRVQ
jgi:hypothetical protein